VSFASEPGRDDGSLPPANIEIPDDARELARDVLAYHRELRARRRRERIARVLRPLDRVGLFRYGTILPLIAICVAVAMIFGAMLSVKSIGPMTSPMTITAPTPPVETGLPQDTVKLDGRFVPVRNLTGSVLVLIPPTCGCGAVLAGIARQAAGARVAVYFVYAAGSPAEAARTARLTATYGDRVARTAYDISGLLFLEYGPTNPVALVVARDGTVNVQRTFPAGFDLSPALRSMERIH